MTKISLLVVSGLLVLSGCAHSLMRGTVAMKVSDSEAHVCLGKDEVKNGDRVGFFVNQCQGGGGKDSSGSGRECQLIKIGEGKVTQALNDHYSVVKANPGVKLDEGTLVEKL